ncbi:sugar phosphate nucleotidyltransferase [Cyclobacterium xiamenense]
MKIINVVLSGGVGSRLWPLSRKSKPKQYLPIFDGQSLLKKQC